MTAPVPYVFLPGTARQALTFYAEVFGCSAEMHTLADFGRTDGPPEEIAHGFLSGGPVMLYIADATGDQAAFGGTGMMLSLLGAAAPDTLHEWFQALRRDGHLLEDLETRSWGATDGQVVDRYGLHWLIGYEHDAV